MYGTRTSRNAQQFFVVKHHDDNEIFGAMAGVSVYSSKTEPDKDVL